MKILVLNYEYPPLGGGGAPVTRELAKRLVQAGHSVDLITMSFKGLERFEVDEGISVYRVWSIRRYQSMSGMVDMFSFLVSSLFFGLKMVKKNRYDIIHSHFIFPTGVVAYVLKKIMGIPLVITCHGSDVPGYNPDRFRIMHILLKPLWNRVVRSADLLTAPSNFLKRLIEARSDANVEVIPNGFDASFYKTCPKEKKILVATRLFNRKGVRYFLTALNGMNLNWEINIAGDGPELNNLKDQAKREGLAVNFLGFIKGEALKNLYETSSIYVFPSIREDFPVALLEAMGAGCAIITTNTSGIPEVVGDAALLTSAGSSKEIRESLKRLIEDSVLRDDLGRRARERVKNFEWDQIAKRYEMLFNGVAGR